MGMTLFHRKVWDAARHMVVLTTVFALVVTPLIVILTHGPAAHQVAASTTADIAGGIAAHGHAHGEDDDGAHNWPFAGHNAADHDHQLQALVCQSAGAADARPDKARCAFDDAFRHLTPDGPRRPPRGA